MIVLHPQGLGAHGWVMREAGLDQGDVEMGQRVALHSRRRSCLFYPAAY